MISGNFRKKVHLMDEKLLSQNRMLNGRQMAWMMFQEFKRTDVEIGMTEFRDLQNIRIKGDNLVAFIHDWDTCMFGMKTEPPKAILESLFTDQVKQCRHFEQVFALYETKCLHEGLEKSYDALRSRVDDLCDQRKQQKITDLATNHSYGR